MFYVAVNGKGRAIRFENRCWQGAKQYAKAVFETDDFDLFEYESEQEYQDSLDFINGKGQGGYYEQRIHFDY